PPAATLSSTTQRSKKNKKKKKKSEGAKDRAKKGKQAVYVNETEGDIDKTLAEINAQYPDLKLQRDLSSGDPSIVNGSPIATSRQKVAQLLSIATGNLDRELEMRRMFGSRVIKENTPGGRNRTQHGASRHHQQPNPHLHHSLRKTFLATPQENWPPFRTGGISMEYIETVDGEMWFTFTHSRAYQEVQLQFLNLLETHSPEHIAGLLRMYPYHVDTALQLSEILKHSGEIAQASELVERALYSFERRFHSMFNMTLGTCRLSFDRGENRPFFLALFRHIQYLTRKGCWRTALEVNKLLFSLNPRSDPLGALLMIDFIAIKSKEFEWFFSLYVQLEQDYHLDRLPNFAYSMALAQFINEGDNVEHSQSSKLLQNAISVFPFVLPGLYEKAAITDSRVTDNEYFQHQSLWTTGSSSENSIKLLCDLYVERCHAIWKEPEVLSWLRSAASIVVSNPSCLEKGRETRKPMYTEGLPHEMYRHIFISDFSNVRVPATILADSQSAHDPLPPPIDADDASTVDASTQANATNSIDALTNFLQALLPWVNSNPAGGSGDPDTAGEDQ
ncbi:hypothetical protein SeLEV6574_g08244, partial [Synchytrium endobioticum]